MSIILIVLGLVFLWAGVNGWRESREHFKRGQKTEAVIVALEDTWIETTENTQGYRAIYAYRDNDGNEHQIRGNRKSTRKGAFPIGARKTVFFTPDRPMEVQDSPAKVFSGLTFALVAGAGMVAFGIAALVLDWDL
jgi:hypothetical protein